MAWEAGHMTEKPYQLLTSLLILHFILSHKNNPYSTLITTEYNTKQQINHNIPQKKRTSRARKGLPLLGGRCESENQPSHLQGYLQSIHHTRALDPVPNHAQALVFF